jgi:DNA processing protein
MPDSKEILYTLVLSRINYFSIAGMLELYRRVGSATAVLEHKNDIKDIIPDATPRLINAFKDIDEAQRRAEAEMEWDEHNNVVPLTMNDDRYPQRLKECDDAPLALYYLGNADLNQARIISIVGTRRCTMYGQDLIRRFTREMKQYCPQVLIVSGLAYGVDINAHRNALENGYETVGVLAHGLDYLYPQAHKNDAAKMIKQGGLLTEFMTCTNADKVNFVRRNRIVAGMCDATLLVESASHGGGLITTRIARDYGRDVFAFPGPVGAQYSEGCNNLIRDNGAGLITCANDFAKAMGWVADSKLHEAKKKGIERQLFPDVSPEEKKVITALQKINDLQINMLSIQAGIPIAHLTALLFSMEMKGIVKTLPGGIYHLLS